MLKMSLGALFIDFENISLALTNQYDYDKAESEAKTVRIIGNILNYLNENLRLDIVIRQAFANWRDYPSAATELYSMGVRTPNVKSTPQKNSADIELSLCVQEIMLTRDDINVLVIVAGDRDYMPISMRIMENAKQVKFVSFRDCFSGDLKQLIGEYNCLFIDSSGRITPKEEVVVEDEVDEIELAPSEEEREIEEQSEPSENELKALKAAIEAFKEFGQEYGSVKLSGFLVDKLAIALPGLNHLQRKEIFNNLVEKNLLNLKSEVGKWGDNFYVFTLNEVNSIVKSEMAKLNNAS